MAHFREVYGEDRVANVATFRTEKSKSAILTAARGLGIDIDIAQYIASLIPADRGVLRTLDQCYYGDNENQPIKQFVIEMNNYPELWEIAYKVEGLICGSGLHAGGVVFVDEPFTESTALMRAPDGTVCTQFELHDLEDAGDIKIDLLSVEALDKMHNCLDLLCEQGYIERKPTLKETYESTIGIYKIDRSNDEMWKMVWNHQIQSLFQLEQQSGITGIALTKPHSVGELATLNSVMRLMAPEKGAEQPLELWAKYINDISIWEDEMNNFNLTVEEKEWVKNHPAFTNGICESQEGLMSLVMEERLGGNPLIFADKLRKQLAKKLGKEGFEKLYNEFIENGLSKGCSKDLMDFIWNCLKVQFGYSFCRAHCLAYSLIALQEMNLAYKYPIMFWNCACLISDAGGNEDTDEDEEVIEELKIEETYSNEMEEFNDEEDEAEDSYEEEDCDGYPAEVIKTSNGKKKKKVKATNYGRIATAIGKIKSTGVEVSAPDINQSGYTFSPDVGRSTIRYGLSGITRIGEDLIKTIIANRPYSGVEDFLGKVKINKPQMVNLIKSGAFDSFGDREGIIRQYVSLISDTKKRVTLQNMKMLIDFKLLPEDYTFQIKVFNFNKYLKKLKEDSIYYGFDNIAFNFFSNNFNVDLLTPSTMSESGFKIKQDKWDSLYQKQMDIVRPYIKSHNQDLLNSINQRLMSDVWNKYCIGNISKWEMDSVSCYMHNHELSNLDPYKYGWVNFEELDEKPIIDRVIPIKGKLIPLFKLYRIAGTVLDRDKAKKTVTLLTTGGVVTVKIYGGVFAQYDKQISAKDADGKKHVIEKSMFTRGNKIIVTGIRQDDSFIAKTYSQTPWHKIEQIIDIVNGEPIIKSERSEAQA